MPTMMQSTLVVFLVGIALAAAATQSVDARNLADDYVHKYKFFCGSSFADFHVDTCHQRQWCPSSSDDECLVPGHTCFANTPCDAREVGNVQVPTYSLSQHPEYRDPSDKMFCGDDYTDAIQTCQAGGEEAIGRHCPDMNCPGSQVCFIDLPCSYFVLTNPAAKPFANIDELEITDEELELPDPGSLSSHFFCGATFQEAAEYCSSETWCRSGTSQECPNGETCYVGVNADNSACEINAIKKAEYEYALANPVVEAAVPTPRPTHETLPEGDERNRNFCGYDWADANTNCALERFCPNGDGDCPDVGMTCFDYTQCDVTLGLTYSPTKKPTPSPTEDPTPSPIATNPTQKPTTAKPSREPTKKPIGATTPNPTMPPSKRPTHSPLPYGDIRREFWCGENWFDAMENCALRCPSGDDKECPGELRCLTGVSDCKNEAGMGVYETTADGGEDGEGGGGLSVGNVAVEPPEGQEDAVVTLTTGNPTTAKPSKEPTAKPVAAVEIGSAANKPSGSLSLSGATNPTATEDALPLQGPFSEDMVRIILYGLDMTVLDSSALDRWKIMTRMYMEDFFNKYPTQEMVPTQEMIDAGEGGMDSIRSSVFDVSIEIYGEMVEMAPIHDFNPLLVGEVNRSSKSPSGNPERRNLRRTQQQQAASGADPTKMIMITYSQTSHYRSTLDVLNDDPRFILQRPLETPDYRAEYVNYLRANDNQAFGKLEYASHFLYTAFPTPAPSAIQVVESPSVTTTTGLVESPPPTDHPTENFGCNLCKPGQFGVNADVVFNGQVSSCMQLYDYFLRTYQQGSGPCREGEASLSDACCEDGVPVKPPTQKPTRNPTTMRPTTKEPTVRPTDLLEIPVDENGLPDAASLAETYYCGENWNSVDSNCDTAIPCPAGDNGECPDGQQCIAFTNCGGKFAFLSDPSVTGGGPNPDEVKSTFFCGTSMQFLEMECDGATPCPNGPQDCEGEGRSYGCFAFTGCNEKVDPGKFVGFLKAPDETSTSTSDAANTYFCASSWADLDSKCVDGVPVGARACPSGDILECEDGHGCFAFACQYGGTGNFVPQAAPSQNRPTSEYSVEDMDLVKSTFFCGTSIEQIDLDCESAIPCPTGDECPQGFGCFAFSQCGGVDIESLVDTFGRTDRPTRAPTVPIVQVCDEGNRMSVNVGYWQSWSVYRDESCQQSNTATFDATPYTHVVYSFASIDSTFRMEAWNGTYDNEVPLYKEFNTVKQRHGGTKTLIAVGGWTHNDPGPMQSRFSQMASSKSNRRTFANSVVQFLRTYGFDGLDLDWEYPGLKERGGKRSDYDNYVLVAKEIRDAFNAVPEPFELSLAIPGNVTKLEMGFDLAGLVDYVDWFNLMSYDLWGSWDPTRSAYSHTDIRMINEAVDYMTHFIQRSKLVLGLGSYARTYTLSDSSCRDLGCPFSEPGKAGCEGTAGFLPYFEIADIVTSRSYDTIRFDDESQSMVMVTDGNTRLISYDNTVSFNRKIQYADDQCFRGHMLWAIDMLKEGSNPLSSNSGNSLSTGDPSDQSFCGRDYTDVISGCRQPCPSGDSAQCPPGEFCFANSGCSLDSIGAPPPTMCRLCPDPSTQGIKDWLEVSYGGSDGTDTTTTCSDVDQTLINDYAKGSEECDSAKRALGGTCCYSYPDNPCMLCRSETEFMDLRALELIEYNGEEMTCFDLNKKLAPEENDSQMCLVAQMDHWDKCCYNQCQICEGQGIKWWNGVEFDGEPLSCGDLDSKLYTDEIEAESEDCTTALTDFVDDCCYDYPNDPCDVCTKDGKRHTLVPVGEIEYQGTTFSCSEVNNFLSPFESTSQQCTNVKGLAFDTCCFDRCSLCGEGARLDSEVLVDINGEQGTCADIESALFQEKITDGGQNCTLARSLFYDSCCWDIPSNPCQLCANDQYMHFDTMIEFNDDKVSCRSASNHLMEREDSSSQTCSNSKAALGETCCFSLCNVCGDYDLDWDVFVNYDGQDMSCGMLNEIFREDEIRDGSEQCEVFKADFYDTCCYTSPMQSCQLCKQGETFYDLKENVEVDFNGPTTCYEVANFLSRRAEDTESVCAVTQTSLFDECCYEKCNLADTPGTYPDWLAEVEMDGNKATCLELEDAIKDASIAKSSDECQSLQDAFSSTCSYSIPQNACEICPDNSVSVSAKAEWNGIEMDCSEIKRFISTREEAGGQVCQSAQQLLPESCCIDQCEVCDRPLMTDSILTVYHNGQTKPCTEVDDFFYEKSILKSSDECSTTRSDYDSCCYTEPETPCNLCKRDTEYFDLMGTNSVTYMNQKMTCADVSDMLFRREEEGGGTCSTARDDFFAACCDTKCSLCEGKGLEAGVKVSYEGRMTTCLELDLGLGPAAIEAGSKQCNEIITKHSEDCCYEKPENPCRVCPDENNMAVNKDASVIYLGTETTCESLSNYLGSREEHQGKACNAATSTHSETCCYERCSLCGEGKADWETFVSYEDRSIACGDFDWILRNDNVEAESDQCSAVREEYYDKCCYTPPETSCNLCHINRNYLDVSADAEVKYQGSQMKCLNLYNSLFVREAANSKQCQTAKDDHGESCCFEKCKMCQYGFLDTTAMVRVAGQDITCSALDMSFGKDVVMEGSSTCDEKRAAYADDCCYTIPDDPCRICPAGYDVDGAKSVDVYGGESKSCTDIANKLAVTEESGSETCTASQKDFSACCFERCPICPDGYNLNWEVDVEYNRATIACGEFDTIIRGNAIQKGTEECSVLRSTYSSSCCYNYATATGSGHAQEIAAEVITTGYLTTNIDASRLTSAQKEEIMNVFQILIKNTLESNGVLPEDSVVTVIDIDEYTGAVIYQIQMYVEGPPPEETIADAVLSQINATLVAQSTLENMSNQIPAESPDSSVSLLDFYQGETSVIATGAVSAAAPCNLCRAGEAGLSKKILFNGVQTSCDEVYKFLSTQEEDGSSACVAGKEALHDSCCMRKCDLCSGGGIPDWYSMVSVNGNSMTCLELDNAITADEITSESEQCSQLHEVAAPACCYTPPTEPCNMCQVGAEVHDVMSSVSVKYGGTTTTCGQIFNTLFSREEHDSQTCSLIRQDLASQCCYNKCSLCGGMQTNAALSVVHDETKLGCSEFDSYIFASNMIEEGSSECKAFQDEHQETCCYDNSCSLCSKGDKVLTTKEDSRVQYGGAEVSCGEVANHLYLEEMSQGNACLAAQENVFSDCCFQQCELCEAGGAVNWAAATTFNGQSQTCTDVYWLLVSEAVEAGTQTCNGLSQVAKDCCYQIPSQQCTLCKDDNGVTYNTRWNTEVTVNGITKTCGDFTTLLATQENDGETCSKAKSEIFSDCCFAGSDTLVAAANQASTEDDASCSLCQPGQVGIKASVIFNNSPKSCEEVYTFLIDRFTGISTTCKAAQAIYSEDCCREQGKLSPSEQPAFGEEVTATDGESSDGEGSVTEQPKGKEITPPMEFDHTWTVGINGSEANASLAGLCTAVISALSIGLFMLM